MTCTRQKLQAALNMWNEFKVDGKHELADEEELKYQVRVTRAGHEKTLDADVHIWKDNEGRLQYTIRHHSRFS